MSWRSAARGTPRSTGSCPRTNRSPSTSADSSDGSLNGRVALVTGGSRGIGRAISTALAAAGAAVAVNYRSHAADAEALVDEIRANGGRATAIAADVADPEQTQGLVERTLADLGDLHVLVNNAGMSKDALIYEMEPSAWLDVMKVNFGGVFNCTRAAMGHFMAAREGSIINISSVMGESAWIGLSNYAASKAAINVFTRCAALELARFGVRVNAILPGFVPTELVDGLMKKDGGRGVLKQIPIRSFGAATDVAALTVFLAAPASRYITGSLLTVDGGLSSTLGIGSPLASG